jgi:hypothetical protein
VTLPHRFPFRLVDGETGGRAVARLSYGAFWSRGGPTASPALLVEAVAQGAALVATPPGAEGARLALAAIEGASWEAAGEAGDTLEIVVTLEGRFGRLVRVRGAATLDGRPAGSASLVLAAG